MRLEYKVNKYMSWSPPWAGAILAEMCCLITIFEEPAKGWWLPDQKAVGRESEAHPAFSIYPSVDSNVISCRPGKGINATFYIIVKAGSPTVKKNTPTRNEGANYEYIADPIADGGMRSLSRPTNIDLRGIEEGFTENGKLSFTPPPAPTGEIPRPVPPSAGAGRPRPWDVAANWGFSFTLVSTRRPPGFVNCGTGQVAVLSAEGRPVHPGHRSDNSSR